MTSGRVTSRHGNRNFHLSRLGHGHHETILTASHISEALGAAWHAQWKHEAHVSPGNPPMSAAGERGALLQACLASHEANRAVRLLIDNQALVQRLHRGMRLGQWGRSFSILALYQDAFG